MERDGLAWVEKQRLPIRCLPPLLGADYLECAGEERHPWRLVGSQPAWFSSQVLTPQFVLAALTDLGGRTNAHLPRLS